MVSVIKEASGDTGRTEVAGTKVSCNFNRGYDRVVTLAQQGKISLSPILCYLTRALCALCVIIAVSSIICSTSKIMVFLRGYALCPMVEHVILSAGG